MRCATASRLMVLACAVVLAVGLSACGSSGKAVDARPDAADGAHDTGATDLRSDLRSDSAVVDLGQDLPPVDMPNLLCEGVSPTMNFSEPYVVANFDTGTNQTFSPFGTSDPVSGGTYYSGGLLEDFADLNWHLTGTVAGDEHFGIYWTCSLPSTGGGCTLDTSRFKGIRFKVKGHVGPDNAMTLSLGRAQNDPAPVNAGCGTCVVPTGSDAATGDYCRGPRAVFPVPGDGSERTVTILWTDFAEGSPFESIDPHQLTGMLWILHPPAPPATTDGGTSDGAPDSRSLADAATDDAADASMSIDPDAAAPDASTPDADPDASVTPGYPVEVTIDDIELVPF